MANARLVFTQHKEYGLNGWRLKRHPTFDPVDGRGVAHDVLEHAPGDNGKVIEEMRALGAFVYTRIESGLMYETYFGNMSVAEILGNDILATFREAVAFGYTGAHLNEKASRWRLASETGYETVFSEAIAFARERWPLELGEDTPEAELATSFFTGHGEAVILTALRAGFRWAERRYKDPYRAARLFRNIEKKVGLVTDHAELGDEIIVHYNLTSLEVKVTHQNAYGYNLETW